MLLFLQQPRCKTDRPVGSGGKGLSRDGATRCRQRRGKEAGEECGGRLLRAQRLRRPQPPQRALPRQPGPRGLGATGAGPAARRASRGKRAELGALTFSRYLSTISRPQLLHTHLLGAQPEPEAMDRGEEEGDRAAEEEQESSSAAAGLAC